MADAAAPPMPFDPPSETIERAVAEQLDFKARLDALERKLDAALHRVSDVLTKLGSLQADVGRIANSSTKDGLTIERVEKKLTVLMKALGVRDV